MSYNASTNTNTSTSDTNTDTDLPPYTGPAIYPQAITLSTLALFSTLLSIPPLVLQLKTKPRNLSTTILILGIALANLQNTINPLLWPNDNLPSWPSGHILCDLEAKIQVWLTTAIPACALCICRRLAMILSPPNSHANLNLTPNPNSSASRTCLSSLPVFDLSLTIFLPTLTTALHILIQPARYYIHGITGCAYSISNSHLSLPLLLLWPPVLSGLGAFYALLVLVRLYAHHRDVGVLLANAATSRSRFVRVWVLAVGVLVSKVPGSIWVCVVMARGGGERWWVGQVHPAGWGRLVLRVPSDPVVLLVSWGQVLEGFYVFVVLGLGRDALAMYRGWWGGVGLVWRWVVKGWRGSGSGEVGGELGGELRRRRDSVGTREGVVRDADGWRGSEVMLDEISIAVEMSEVGGENKTEVHARSVEL